MLTGAGRAVAAGTVYIVDATSPTCGAQGPGTPAQPFCTIAGAANVAAAGDTVLVQAGTYPGTAVNPKNSGVTFAANSGVTISGGTKAFAISSRNNITISGFTITNTGSNAISVSGGSNVTISNNVESFAGTPITSPGFGIYLSNVAGGLVQGNVTHDNSAHGIYLSGTTTGVMVRGNTSYHNAYQYQRNANGIDVIAPGNSIVGNVTYSNEDSGINMYTGANNTYIADNLTYGNGDHGIDDLNVTGGRIIGNTVYGNCTTGINVEGTSGNYVVEDNVSMNNATGAVINPTPIPTNPSTGGPYYTNTCNRRHGNIGIWDSAPATTTANYNLVYQTSGSAPEYFWAGSAYNTQAALSAASGQEASGIFANPLFVNAAGGNFQLSVGSRAIDSADSLVAGEPATDILGNARVDDPATANTGNPSGSYFDRGAYEYQPQGSGGAQTISFTAPASGTVGGSATLSATGGGSGNPVVFSVDASSGSGVCNVSGSNGSTVNYAGAGSCVIDADQAAGNGYTAAPTVQQSITVGSNSQTISFTAPASGTVGGSATLSATGGGSGNPVVFSVDASSGSGVCNVSGSNGSTVNYTGAGSCVIDADQAGGNGYTAAPTVQRSITVSQGQSPNLVGNAGFETDLTGWNTSGSDSGVTISRVAGGHTGGWAARLTNTSSVASTCLLNDSPNWVTSTVSKTYTGSLWVRADTAGAVVKLRIREYNGSTLVGTGTAQVTLTTSWQQVSLSYAPAAPGVSTLDFNAYVSKAATGTAFYADDAVITTS